MLTSCDRCARALQIKLGFLYGVYSNGTYYQHPLSVIFTCLLHNRRIYETVDHIMSSAHNGSSPSPNGMLTPCRAVGLRRRSSGTPSLHANVLKKTKFAGEAKKCIEFNDSEVATTTVGVASENKLTNEEDRIRKNIKDKRREIEQLKCELRNSRQVRVNFFIIKNLSSCKISLLHVCHNQSSRTQ